MNGIYSVLMNFSTQYLLLPVFIIGFLLIDSGTRQLDNVVMDTIDLVEEEEDELKRQIKLRARSVKRRKVSQFHHKGYAFSGQQG